MDFSFSKQELMLAKTAREFFKKECSPDFVSEMVDDKKGYSSSMWLKMADLGFTGIMIEEKHGGIGANFLDLSVLLEEMGKVLLPSPYFATVILSGLILQECASDSLQNKYLPSIASGEVIASVALSGESGYYFDENIGISAEKRGDRYIISGKALFVPYAGVCDIILCIARTLDCGTDQGPSLFVLEATKPELQINPMPSISGDKLCEVFITAAEVAAEQMIGAVGRGWDQIRKVWPKIVTAKCIEATGATRQVLDMTVSYVKERKQFGRPLAAFQAIQHQCADMAILVETSEILAYHAAWTINAGLPCEKEAAMAKAWCSEAFKKAAAIAHQAHGAFGFTEEYYLHLFSKRAKAWEVTFGDTEFHRQVVAQSMGL